MNAAGALRGFSCASACRAVCEPVRGALSHRHSQHRSPFPAQPFPPRASYGLQEEGESGNPRYPHSQRCVIHTHTHTHPLPEPHDAQARHPSPRSPTTQDTLTGTCTPHCHAAPWGGKAPSTCPQHSTGDIHPVESPSSGGEWVGGRGGAIWAPERMDGGEEREGGWGRE